MGRYVAVKQRISKTMAAVSVACVMLVSLAITSAVTIRETPKNGTDNYVALCMQCTQSSQWTFFRIYWFGLLAPRYACKKSLSDISQYSIITDTVCSPEDCHKVITR